HRRRLGAERRGGEQGGDRRRRRDQRGAHAHRRRGQAAPAQGRDAVRLLQRVTMRWLALLCLFAACQDEAPFTHDEWAMLESLSPLPPPPGDTSNEYIGNPAAESLGQKLYYDTGFSGVVVGRDMLYRPVPTPRAPVGEEANIA